jgi:Cu2+-exporting ATPase
VRYAESKEVTLMQVQDFNTVAGKGLEGTVGGERVYGGSAGYIGELCNVPEDISGETERLTSQGKTPLFFAKGGNLIGAIFAADVIKDDSAKAISELKNMGVHVVMLTGDNENTARVIGEQAGVDEVIAGVLPDGKEKVIRQLQKKGTVAMVGDGINDAPALTRADIGIAIGAGTDIAIDAGDVVLMKSQLSDVPALLRLSRSTLRTIHQNLFWAFFYNALGIPLAAGLWIPIFGWTLNPMFGAAAMSLSSFCVVSNALRLNLVKIYSCKHDRKIRKKLKASTESQGGMSSENEITIRVDGMMCEHCERRVRECLEAFDEIEAAQAEFKDGTVKLTVKSQIDLKKIRKAVSLAGYKMK